MTLIHSVVSHAKGGVSGLQASQRDWSPFVVHFTSYQAMGPVREALPRGSTPAQVATLLDTADSQSFSVLQVIAKAGLLKASIPEGKDEADPCVCFSECTLPGLISLAERYGRFGFGFRKTSMFGMGARPCAYLAQEHYAITNRLALAAAPSSHERRLHDISNVYRPAGRGQIQDFTHEREWRLFGDLRFETLIPEFIIAPSAYLSQTRALLPVDALVFPIDLLFEWGA